MINPMDTKPGSPVFKNGVRQPVPCFYCPALTTNVGDVCTECSNRFEAEKDDQYEVHLS